MALKVIFPVGTNDISIKGLYQWDYGQTLEIEAGDIGTEIVEVHFACTNMTEAIVRSCSFVDGIGTVTVPDQCLEQSSNITAWIYKIKGAEGHTIKTITLPIVARIKPSKLRDIPPEIYDKYVELITEVNEIIDNLENGTVTVGKAQTAVNANHATSAGNAASASHATSASRADEADHAALSTAATTVRVNTLDEIKTLLLNRPFQTFGVSVGNQPISIADIGTIPAWSLGTAVTDPTGIRLCLTNVEKNTVTVYGTYDAEKNEWAWRFMPESAKKISGAGVYTPGLYCVNIVADGTRTTHMLSIENLDDTVFSIADSSGSVATYWGTTRQVTVPTNMELESLVCVAPYIF